MGAFCSQLFGGQAQDPDALRNISIKGGHAVGNEGFCSNIVTTSKYTLLTFLPLNLFEQISRPANFYFLCMAVMQSIKAVSISDGKPTILSALVFVLSVSAIKDAFEDRKRHKQDKEDNNRLYSIFRDGDFKQVQSKDIIVGDIVQIMEDHTFPADLLFITSGAEDGPFCFVETASLDGETNLKVKQVPESLQGLAGVKDLTGLDMSLQCEAPNAALDRFGGGVTIDGGETPVTIENLLLRGSQIRNTPWIYGLAVFTGHDSKIRQNTSAKATAKVKRSSVEIIMNKMILGMLVFQIIICFIAAIASGTWENSHLNSDWYLKSDDNIALGAVARFFTWFIIMSGFVPIALMVSMEMVKFWQALFIQWDAKMKAEVKGEDLYANVQASGLNEELGQVQYIFSDKTGTLTCNRLEFRKCVIGMRQYGVGETEISMAAKARVEARVRSGSISAVRNDDLEDRMIAEKELKWPHVMFNQETRLREAMAKGDEHSEEIEQYLLALALSNTIFPVPSEQEGGMTDFKASSPDDLALCRFAEVMGYELHARVPPTITVRQRDTPDSDFKAMDYVQLALLDFTSKRKRMSVIVRCPDGRVMMCSKGADSSIGPLLKERGDTWDFAMQRLDVFGSQGLRTLLVATATRDASFWDDPNDGWAAKYAAAVREFQIEGPAEKGHFKGACSDECRRCKIETDLEQAFGLNLVGATAIEDKLQEGVPDSIHDFLQAGVKVWVLTGDKLETAINIGMACRLLETDMEDKGNLFLIDQTNQEDVLKTLTDYRQRINDLKEAAGPDGDIPHIGLVVTSQALTLMCEVGEQLLATFLYVATHCKSVVGCRLQPNQKALIVKLVKDSTQAITLSIGDGANDEPMIKMADVGVGIAGEEGSTAVAASDYSFARFRFLHRLMFVHGHYNYRRVCMLMLYIFYKNAAWSMVFLWHGFYSGFSGLSVFNEWAMQLNHVVYTPLPIIIFCIFDQNISDKILTRSPVLYRYLRGGRHFNARLFAGWMSYAVIQSLLAFFIPLYSTSHEVYRSDGHVQGVWSLGITILMSLCFINLTTLAFYMKSWTWLHHATVWGSVVLCFLCYLFLSSSSAFAAGGNDPLGIFPRLLASPHWWLQVMLTAGVPFVLDLTLHGYQTAVAPSMVTVAREAQLLGKDLGVQLSDEMNVERLMTAQAEMDKYAHGPGSPMQSRGKAAPDPFAPNISPLTSPSRGQPLMSPQIGQPSSSQAELEMTTMSLAQESKEQEDRPRSESHIPHKGFVYDATPGLGPRLGFPA